MKADNINSNIPQTILFTHYGDNWIRGSERCLIDLLKHLDRDRFEPVVFCNSAVFADKIQHLNVTVYQAEFPLPGKALQRFAVKDLYRLYRQAKELIDKHQVKLIHANSGAPNQWLNLVARSRNIPLLTHLHSSYSLRDRMTFGLHHVAMAVGVSNSVIDALLKDGMPSGKTCVIQNGIDTRRLDKEPVIDIRGHLNLNNDDFLIATTGSLIHRKGIDRIISSIKELEELGVPAHLVIIGEGSERENLQKQINKLDLSKKVQLLGEQSNVAGMLRGGVDLFVSAAREEAFGLVLAEASLSGLAIVASNVGGIPDVVINNKTGILIDTADSEKLSSTIHYLYNNPIRRNEMGYTGRQHILENLTIERNVKAFESLYMKLLENPSMHMRWHSHWEILKPFFNTSKRLFELAFNRNGVKQYEY